MSRNSESSSAAPSFRWKLLSAFLGFYLLIGTGSAFSILANYQRALEQLRTSHEKWLQTYAETFLSDIEVGNFISVQKKMDILVQRDIVASAILRFGRHELASKKPPTKRRDRVHVLDRLIAHLFQSGRISIDVSDASRSVWGNLEVNLDLALLYEPIANALKTFAVFGSAFFLLCLSLILFHIDTLTATVQSLIGYIQLFSRANHSSTDIHEILQSPPELNVLELSMIAKEFESSVKNVMRLEAEIEQHRLSAAIGEVSRQVAHDIRSPLAALDSVLKDLTHIPEENRVIMRSAVGRIRDIANQLLFKHDRDAAAARGEDASEERPGAPPEVFLLSSLLDSVITEKRLQFRSKIGIEIENHVDAASYGLFAGVQAVEFKRLMSNLVNNAVEALGDAGTVTVRLVAEGERITLKVQDSGKGILPELLAKLGKRGETHGKAGGLGLGLYHARTAIESWGGSLELQSEVGHGTTVALNLPKAQPREWFVSILELDANRPVIVLDDDTSIHQVWQGRFDSLRPMGQALKVLHFSTPAELRDWVKADAARARDAVYLMDHELLGHKDTGLALIAELGLGEQAILVTSRFEEKAILEECLRLKTRMIPKGLAGFVPIRVRPTRGTGEHAPVGQGAHLDAVLIDDDPLTQMNWEMAASRSGKKFQSFSTVAEFLKEAPMMSRETPIYIDADLADGVNGAQESLRIKELGFLEIYLATGHEAARFAAYKHLRGVIGKEPPWNQAG